MRLIFRSQKRLDPYGALRQHLFLAIAGFVFVLCRASVAQQPPTKTPAGDVELRADRLMRQMSEYLSTADQLTFAARVTVEEINNGQKLEFERNLETFMRRPDKVRTNFEGEGGSKCFWYDGSTITLLDVEQNLYASSKAPAVIDGALDFAMETCGVTVPVADLLFSNPYESFMSNVETGMYVGRSKVGGVTCHHLAFTQESIDWQIWITDGAQLVPIKLVITYKNVPGQPQYRAVFSNWNLAPRLPEALFGFEAPKEAEQIQFLSAQE